MPGGPRGLQNRRRPVLRDEVGSIPTLSAHVFVRARSRRRVDYGIEEEDAVDVQPGKEVILDVARADIKINRIIILRRVSFQTQPKGSDASFASASPRK